MARLLTSRRLRVEKHRRSLDGSQSKFWIPAHCLSLRFRLTVSPDNNPFSRRVGLYPEFQIVGFGFVQKHTPANPYYRAQTGRWPKEKPKTVAARKYATVVTITTPAKSSMMPARAICGMVTHPLPNTMALGGVETGSIKAQEVEIVAGIINRKG